MRVRRFWGVYLFLAVVVCGQVFGETEYLAVFMEGKKVGYAVETREATGGKVTSTEQVNITLTRAGFPLSVKMTETSIETADGKALGFESVQDLGIMAMRTVGVVNKQGMVDVTTNSMGTAQKSTFEWPGGAVMAEGARLFGLKKGLKEGSSYAIKLFSPAIMGAVDTQIRVGPRRKVDLLGRVVALTEIVSVAEISGAGQVVTTSYVNDDMRMLKSSMPMMGMSIEMVACTKEFALGDNDVLEMVDKMFLPSPVALGDVGSAESISYLLVPKIPGDRLAIPSGDNQEVREVANGGLIVTVKPAQPPKGARFPYKGVDEIVLDAMKPTRFVQSDRKEIIELAHRAVGRTKDAAEAAKRIEKFVAEYIENKGLSVGYASAAEVAASREGDCTEFAVLTAAMCRAVGIPAQVAMGFAYVKDFAGLQNRFGGHAWVRAYIGRENGKWIGLDAAFRSAGRSGYGPGHIGLVFGSGDPEDFFGLVGSLGRFRIDKATVNKGR